MHSIHWKRDCNNVFWVPELCDTNSRYQFSLKILLFVLGLKYLESDLDPWVVMDISLAGMTQCGLQMENKLNYPASIQESIHVIISESLG